MDNGEWRKKREVQGEAEERSAFWLCTEGCQHNRMLQQTQHGQIVFGRGRGGVRGKKCQSIALPKRCTPA